MVARRLWKKITHTNRMHFIRFFVTLHQLFLPSKHRVLPNGFIAVRGIEPVVDPLKKREVNLPIVPLTTH